MLIAAINSTLFDTLTMIVNTYTKTVFANWEKVKKTGYRSIDSCLLK